MYLSVAKHFGVYEPQGREGGATAMARSQEPPPSPKTALSRQETTLLVSSPNLTQMLKTYPIFQGSPTCHRLHTPIISKSRQLGKQEHYEKGKS